MENQSRLPAIAGILFVLALLAGLLLGLMGKIPTYSPEQANAFDKFVESAKENERAGKWFGVVFAVAGAALIWFLHALSSNVATVSQGRPWLGSLLRTAGSLWGFMFVLSGALMYGAAEAANYQEQPQSALALWMSATALSSFGPAAVVPAVAMLAAGLLLRAAGAGSLTWGAALAAGAMFAVATIPEWPLLGLGAPAMIVTVLWVLGTSLAMLRNKPLAGSPAAGD